MYQGGSIYSVHYDTKEYMVVSSQVVEDSCLYSENILYLLIRKVGTRITVKL